MYSSCVTWPTWYRPTSRAAVPPACRPRRNLPKPGRTRHCARPRPVRRHPRLDERFRSGRRVHRQNGWPSRSGRASAFSPNRRIAELPNCRIAESPNCRIAELPNCRIAELPNCRIAELPNCRIAELPNCRIAELPNCRIAGIAELPNCRIAEQAFRIEHRGLRTGRYGDFSLENLMTYPSYIAERVAAGADHPHGTVFRHRSRPVVERPVGAPWLRADRRRRKGSPSGRSPTTMGTASWLRESGSSGSGISVSTRSAIPPDAALSRMARP